jgi:hypothetical protein
MRDGFSPPDGPCVVPIELSAAFAWGCVVIYPAAVCLSIYNEASSKRSFFSRDREAQLIIVVGILTDIFTFCLFPRPSGVSEHYRMSKHWTSAFALIGAILTISWGLLGIIYRFLRRGIRYAFALNPDTPAVVLQLNGIRAVHLFVVTVVMGLYGWKVFYERTEEAREAFIILWICTTHFPPILLHMVAVSQALSTIKRLPLTEQSRPLRRNLNKFHKKNLHQAGHSAVFVVLALASIAFSSFMFSFIIIGHLFLKGFCLGVIGNLYRCCASETNSLKKRHNQHHRIQVIPSTSVEVNTLVEWEKKGKQLRSGADGGGDESAESELPTIMGLSFAALKQFQEENGLADEEWTMAEVCAKLIKGKTLFRGSAGTGTDAGTEYTDARAGVSVSFDSGDDAGVGGRVGMLHCPYAELMTRAKATDSSGRPLVATATHFLSYTWSYPWQVVYSALESFELRHCDLARRDSVGSLAEQQQQYYFIDQFSLDQNIMTSKNVLSQEQMQAEIQAKLRHSIQVPGNVLMLLHPWSAPVVLSRAWCLYEVYTAILLGASVQMCFTPEDERGFFAALERGLFDAKAVCSTVDAMQATATEQADKEMILHRISEDIGLAEYNEKCRLYLEEQYNLVALQGQTHATGGASELKLHHGGHSTQDGRGDGGGSRADGTGASTDAAVLPAVLKQLRLLHKQQQQLGDRLERIERQLVGAQQQGGDTKGGTTPAGPAPAYLHHGLKA